MRLLLVILAACVVCAPAVALAQPVSADAFADKIESALSVVGSGRSTIASETVAADVALRVEMLLPLDLEVSEGTRTVTVADNATVHLLTDRLRTAGSASDRTEAADRLADHLRAARVALGTAGAAPWDADELARLLAERPVTTGTGPNWLSEQLEKLLDAFAQWLGGLFGDSAGANAGGLSLAMRYAVVALPVILAAWILVRSLRRRSRRRAAAVAEPGPGPHEPVVAAAADLPDDPLEHARVLEARGLRRDAVRVLYGGAARHLVETGVVARMRTRTNHEMLRDVSSAAPELQQPFSELTDRFERAWYGHGDPGHEGFAEASRSYQLLVNETLAANRAGTPSADATGGDVA